MSKRKNRFTHIERYVALDLILCGTLSQYSFRVPTGDGQAKLAWVTGYMPRPRARQKTVTHPSTNRAWCRVTLLIETYERYHKRDWNKTGTTAARMTVDVFAMETFAVSQASWSTSASQTFDHVPLCGAGFSRITWHISWYKFTFESRPNVALRRKSVYTIVVIYGRFWIISISGPPSWITCPNILWLRHVIQDGGPETEMVLSWPSIPTHHRLILNIL